MTVNGLAVGRALGAAGVSVLGVGAAPLPAAARSRYFKRVVACAEVDGPGLIEALEWLGQSLPSRHALFLTSDQQVEHVSAQRGRLEPYFSLRLPEHHTVTTLIDKSGFDDTARRLQFDLPRTVVAHDAAQMKQAMGKLDVPLVIKPQERAAAFERMFGGKALRCDTAQSAQAAALLPYDFAVPLLLQEWVPGGDDSVYFSMLYIDAQGRVLRTFTGRKLRQSPPGLGHTAVAEPVALPGLGDTTARFFAAAGMRGLCSMEFKRHAVNGRFLMIEPTIGRTDWQSGVAEINGVSIITAAYRDLCGLPPQPDSPRRSGLKWVDFRSDLNSAAHYVRAGQLTWLKWALSLWPCRFAVFRLEDPGPTAAAVLERLQRLPGAIARRWARRRAGRLKPDR